MRRRSFVLPHPYRSHPGWGIASVAVHAVLIVLVLTAVGRSVATRSDLQFIQLPPLRTDARQHDLPAATSPAVPAATAVVTEQVASADTAAGPTIVITPRLFLSLVVVAGLRDREERENRGRNLDWTEIDPFTVDPPGFAIRLDRPTLCARGRKAVRR